MCINGSAPQIDAATCADFVQLFDFHAVCESCPHSVYVVNDIVYATGVVGAASATVCLAVAVTIVARGRDCISMRDRIVLGLMLINAVYSTANTLPLNELQTGAITCGRLAMPLYAIRFGRAWWFCGKYGLVSFELFMLAASIRALLKGLSAMPLRVEVASHIVCYVTAMTAFVIFYRLCADINHNGYNDSTESEAFSNSFSHVSVSDDHDDGTPYVSAQARFRSGRDQYDKLVQNMLIAWDILVGCAIVLWLVLRLMHHRVVNAFRTQAKAVARAEANDIWVDTRRSAWAARRRLLQEQQKGFAEVAKPLEPYIAVFVVFAVPAFVMSTTFCQNNSRESNVAPTTNSFAGSTHITYGTCDVWCEFVLAFGRFGRSEL